MCQVLVLKFHYSRLHPHLFLKQSSLGMQILLALPVNARKPGLQKHCGSLIIAGRHCAPLAACSHVKSHAKHDNSRPAMVHGGVVSSFCLQSSIGEMQSSRRTQRLFSSRTHPEGQKHCGVIQDRGAQSGSAQVPSQPRHVATVPLGQKVDGIWLSERSFCI